MKYAFARFVAFVGIVTCTTLAALEIRPLWRDVRTSDRNGDGRPDVWRHFDAGGQLTEVDLDSNFDGKPDIEEFYDRGVLIRRESDRDFNGQADLVEEFDAATHEQTRSTLDIDFDGTADLLVLYQEGRPVFSKCRCTTRSAGPPPAAVDAESNQLAPLIDPFQSEMAIRAPHSAPGHDICIGLPASSGLPSARVECVCTLPRSARDVSVPEPFRAASLVFPRSPRAPPAV